MAVSLKSQIGGNQQALDAISDKVLSSLRAAIVGIIQSFDADEVTCVVQPSIQGASTDSSGVVSSLSLPLLVDVPVVFPRGGGCTLTFPVSPGDECLIVFADRCIDFWWQSGGVQEPVSNRMHSLSDAFVIVGAQSQANKISGISTNATQLRTDDGAAFVEVAAGHDITVTTPGKLTASAQGGTEITSPTIVLNGDVTINGNLSQGMGAGGGKATMQGLVTVTNDVTAGGKSLMTHTHGGVQPGSGDTGAPN
ncbi:phage baseplate assembly protein V [Candidatus Symbiopectobacterium sp. NZEC127]|uniref:phage baseplate assembly protein V n=1 Tax=Candidatus Symbiopectobacterium sp. NZEC127 TaxID=2820472 RepID=UPI002225C69F|nr:phage baseplate assembly protein V [Candidatus Symbiopectobacterium sp. NZEC127]MCW2485713.1 phage baseplate assembly protein V [Candidatus Symbiopectobacterium sp. NZEC127]